MADDYECGQAGCDFAGTYDEVEAHLWDRHRVLKIARARYIEEVA